MTSSPLTDPLPQVARVTLRIEYADRKIREFAAEKPYGLECEITHSLPQDLGWRGPAVPYLIESDCDVAGVRLGFKASGDRRHPMTLRTEAAPSSWAKLAEIREWAEALDAEGEPTGTALLHMLDR